jgi:hypothetical protein
MQISKIYSAQDITFKGLYFGQLQLERAHYFLKLAVSNETYEEAAGILYGIEAYLEIAHMARIKGLLKSLNIKNEI